MELTFRVKRIEAGENGRANVTLEYHDNDGVLHTAGLWIGGLTREAVVRLHDEVKVTLELPASWERPGPE